jgi:tetratricopeptide (TPR) repeat protein
LDNSERLLSKGRPRDAKALLDKMQEAGDNGSSLATSGDAKALILRGKVLYAVLMDELRQERWGSYGVNPDNWIQHPLAEEAENCFLDAIKIAPNDTEARQMLGNLYREQGRFADAESILRSALEIDGTDAEAFLTLGLLYAEGGRHDAAQKALAYAWELDPGNSRIAKNIAYFYRYYKDIPESSIVWFTRYIDTDPKRDPDINLIRAELRTLLERYPEFEKYKTEPKERRGIITQIFN